MKKSKFIYLIFGMGRSATSFLAKAVKDQGVPIGENLYMGENVNGGFEDNDFFELNKKIIEKAGGAWGLGAIPPDQKEIDKAGKQFKDEIIKLLDKDLDVWGVKEPRLSLTIGSYYKAILEKTDDPFLFICFRRPEKVADDLANLAEKNGMEIDRDRYLQVAKEYNKRIIKFLKKYYV